MSILDTNDCNSLAKWSSLELLGEADDSPPPHSSGQSRSKQEDSIFNQDFLMRVASERGTKRQLRSSQSMEKTHDVSPPGSPILPSCSTTILILVVHAGSVLGKWLYPIVLVVILIDFFVLRCQQ